MFRGRVPAKGRESESKQCQKRVSMKTPSPAYGTMYKTCCETCEETWNQCCTCEDWARNECAGVESAVCFVRDLHCEEIMCPWLPEEYHDSAKRADKLLTYPPPPPRRTGFTPDFRKWESCRTMPLAGRIISGISRFPALSFRRCSILTSFLSRRLRVSDAMPPSPSHLASYLVASLAGDKSGRRSGEKGNPRAPKKNRRGWNRALKLRFPLQSSQPGQPHLRKRLLHEDILLSFELFGGVFLVYIKMKTSISSLFLPRCKGVFRMILSEFLRNLGLALSFATYHASENNTDATLKSHWHMQHDESTARQLSVLGVKTMARVIHAWCRPYCSCAYLPRTREKGCRVNAAASFAEWSQELIFSQLLQIVSEAETRQRIALLHRHPFSRYTHTHTHIHTSNQPFPCVDVTNHARPFPFGARRANHDAWSSIWEFPVPEPRISNAAFNLLRLRLPGDSPPPPQWEPYDRVPRRSYAQGRAVFALWSSAAQIRSATVGPHYARRKSTHLTKDLWLCFSPTTVQAERSLQTVHVSQESRHWKATDCDKVFRSQFFCLSPIRIPHVLWRNICALKAFSYNRSKRKDFGDWQKNPAPAADSKTE
ncbi:hypothetical protein PR048_032749 [Dryococelus australis]|uniref:Uncharacterized protein n=1 Tax=Dryococelus australis TaxID=614101 RepID=A0ABQ9G331_9NEOP|nr:hypothetical protein PR048_032749 [Dryococelus australis]